MMWIASLKENINKIALDVHDDDYDEDEDEDEDDEVDELEIHGSRSNGIDSPSPSPSVSDRRRRSYSHRLSHSLSASSQSPFANGIGSPHNSEIERYRSEIKRLQESEAEIKGLSVNYAALLKEKEDHISRLKTENGSLKKNLNETNAILNTSRNESFKTSTSSPSALKGSTDQSPNRQHRLSTPVKNRFTGNQIQNGVLSKHDASSNGTGNGSQPDIIQSKMDAKHSNLPGKEKELTVLLEEKDRSLAALQGTHELQMKQLKTELEKEREMLRIIQLNLQEEHKLNATFQEELKSLKMDKDKTSMEMSNIQKELNEKISEIKRLRMEFRRREDEDADATIDSLKRTIRTLEKENTNIKMEKDELQAAVKKSKILAKDKFSPNTSEPTDKLPSNSNEVQSSGSSTGKEELQISLQKLEKELKEACQERDKALHELNRLKQHLLEKESEESDKMDEDIKIIEELRQNNEYQRAHILHLEKALKQAIARQEEVKLINHDELQKSKEIIDDINRKLASCMSTIDAKNVEIQNLQTALGQYYAEIEAKERLESNLALAREESAKLSELLKDEQQQAEISKREKEEILAKLSQAERTFGEGKSRVNKLEEDNAKLRRALEQSMTRINRMSVDSDYFVDRRIVIKLLVTYFQRNHSKEVLDLMVRMLGFSDEDKQRIGGAQQGAGKGVVRGVLGFPGRLVGGILGGGSAEGHANMASENQSFADLWVDFLLKETEARERMEMAEATGGSKENPHGRSPDVKGETSSNPRTSTAGVASVFSRTSPSLSQSPNPQSLRGNYMHSENSDSEFSTVPLTSSDGNSRISRLLPKY